MVNSCTFDREDFLSRLTKALEEEGFTYRSPSEIRGRSGVTHVFDIQVEKGASRGSVVIDLASSPSAVDEASVLRCFAKSYDVNPSKMILIAHPKLTDAAKNLAQLYKIIAIEAVDEAEASRILLASLKRIVEENPLPTAQ
ncbi:MAG: hypothetical protein HYU39_04030 [Thaumarchaeota archaeon]|nr:hypothetical protein [Nitrososphaerota archaeon]